MAVILIVMNDQQLCNWTKKHVNSCSEILVQSYFIPKLGKFTCTIWQ